MCTNAPTTGRGDGVDTVFKRCSTESGSEKCDSADRENVDWWSVTKLFEVWT